MLRLGTVMMTVLIVVAAACAAVEVPVQNLKPAALSGFVAKAQATGGKVAVSFKKAGDERRLLAIEGTLAANPAGALAAEVSYEVVLTSGEAPRLAVIAWEKGGGSYYKVAGVPVKLGQAVSGRVSTAGLVPTAFSTDASGQLEWDQVERLWAGFVFDGPAEGTATVNAVKLTDTAVVPTGPVTLINLPGKVNDGHDPAVKTTITSPAEGPGGKPCFKYEFEVPAGKHMFACPSAPVIAEDLEGYKTLRFQLKSQIPPGMRLLVQMSEQGGPVYYIERPAPGPAEWTQVSILLSEFKPATWGPKDENGQLDVAKLNTLSIGSHGVPEKGLLGTIMICDVELVP